MKVRGSEWKGCTSKGANKNRSTSLMKLQTKATTLLNSHLSLRIRKVYPLFIHPTTLEGGTEIDNWTFEELKAVVQEYKVSQSDQSLPHQPSAIPPPGNDLTEEEKENLRKFDNNLVN